MSLCTNLSTIENKDIFKGDNRRKGSSMSLFTPSASYTSIDRQKQDQINQFYTDNTNLNQRFWREALIDTMFEAGDQTLWSGFFLQYPNMNKPMFNFNQLRRIKNMISGRQRQHRKSSVVIPSDNGDQKTADQLTKILLWNNRQASVLETISDAFDQALTTGLALLQVNIDFRDDPISGDLSVDVCTYDAFVMDIFWRKPDLSDCNGIWRRTWQTPQYMASILPDGADIGKMDGRDGKFSYMPEVLYASSGRNLVALDEFYYRDYRDATILIDPQNGATTEWTGSKDDLREFIGMFPHIIVEHTRKPTVKLCRLANGRVIDDTINPLHIDRYPFAPVTAYFNPAITDYSWKIQGVIRSLRDSAFLFNRINVILLDMLESKINSGWKYIDGTLVDPTAPYKTGQGQCLVLKKGSDMSQVEQIVPNEIPSSYFQVLEGLAKNPERISGVNEELLGSAIDDKAGVLSMLRQGAGLTTLQGLFDQLDRSQKLLDEIRLEAITANFTPGKVQMICGEDPTPFFYKQAFSRYTVAIEDGLNTSTQKQMQFAQLMELRQINVNVPDRVLLDAVTIQDKQKLIDAIEQEQQAAAQAQQQQMQVEQQELMARAKLAEARAMADQGLGMERLSRIEENKALAEERKAAAVKDEEQAFLNLVKGLKEIDDIDLAHLQKAVALMQMIKQQENPTPDGQKAGVKLPGNGQKARITPTKTIRTAEKIKSKGGK